MATKLSPSREIMTSQAHHWRMKRLVLILLLLAGHLSILWAEPFEQAEVTKAINLVSLLPHGTRAMRGDIVTGNTALKTGGDSRAELEFPDLTITRVGSNALFRFVAGTREIILDGGTMLFSSPKGAGGGQVQAGAITAAVTGSDFLVSNAGRVKVICLSHKVVVYFTANPKIRAVLLPGQMLDIAAGEKKMPPTTTIKLTTLLATSMLGEAGGLGSFPSQTILAYNASKQEKAFVPVNSPAPANSPTPANMNLTAQAAQTVRSTTVAQRAQTGPSSTVGNSNPPSQFAAQGAQTAPSGAVANSNPPSQSTAAPATTGSPPDTTADGTGRNRRNNSNIRNIENRGNRGNRGNNSNIRNIENRGNSGNRGNNSNIRNIENRGNSGNAPGRAGR
jgi:FecR protein